MVDYFLDTSALAKCYLEEQGTERMLDIFESGAVLFVSHLSLVEAASAGMSRFRRGELNGELLVELLACLENDFQLRFRVVPVSAAVLSESVAVVRRHPVRAADAIQLASALSVRGPGKSGPLFVSSDKTLNAAAANEGLEILNPQGSDQ